MNHVAAGGLVAALLLLGGCADESDPPPDAGQEPTVSQSDKPSTQPPTPAPSPSAGPIEQAKSDLARRLGVQAGEVKLVSSEEVTWRDGSLGCPQPGMRYTQVLINGSRIVLEAGGKRYYYHSGGRRGPFLCTNPQPPLASGG